MMSQFKPRGCGGGSPAGSYVSNTAHIIIPLSFLVYCYCMTCTAACGWIPSGKNTWLQGYQGPATMQYHLRSRMLLHCNCNYCIALVSHAITPAKGCPSTSSTKTATILKSILLYMIVMINMINMIVMTRIWRDPWKVADRASRLERDGRGGGEDDYGCRCTV